MNRENTPYDFNENAHCTVSMRLQYGWYEKPEKRREILRRDQRGKGRLKRAKYKVAEPNS